MEKEKIIEYVRKLITVHGLCMLPLKDGEKHPDQNWSQFRSRLPNEAEISSWEERKRWGIVCGKVSGNLEAIDFDEKVRKGIFEEWKSLLPPEASELLKTLPQSQTFNNGFHVLYRCREIEGSIKLASCLNKEDRQAGMIETRGEGGFIVEPPTEGYTHINGSLEHIPEITPKQRRVFWDTARALNEIVEEHRVIAKKSQPNDGARPGDDYNTRATWEEILLPLEWTPVGQRGEKRFWKRPGKTEDGISATENYAGNGLLHVFSTSTPLEPGKSYTKFSAYAILHHKGDFASATRELANRRYGNKKELNGMAAENIIIATPRLWSIGEILGTDFGTEEWVVESLIPKQGMMALSGNPGDFKTWVTIHIALCMSRNTPVFGRFHAAQGNVLIVDEEDHLRGIKKRLGFLGAKDTDTIFYMSQSNIKIDTEESNKMILGIVEEKNIKLVILDSLVRIHEQKENDSWGMAKVFGCLQKLTKAGASILFTHHHRKQGFGPNIPGQSMRGSSDILAAVDCHITIEKKRDEEDLLVIKQSKLRQDEELKPFEVKILKEAVSDQGKPCPSGFEYAGGHEEKKKKAEEAAEALVLLLSEGMKSRQEIHESLKGTFGKEAIDTGVKIAEGTGTIERVPKEELSKENRKKFYYRLLIASSPTITGGKDDLPVSQSTIGFGKQEDAEQTPKDRGDDGDARNDSFWDPATF